MLVGDICACVPLSAVQPSVDSLSVFSSLVQVNILIILLLVIKISLPGHTYCYQ